MSPSKTLSSSTDFLGAPVIRLPCSADFAAGRGGLLQLLSASLPSCCRFHPARVKPPLQSACDDPCCLRPTDAGSASGVTHFRGHFRVYFRYGPMAHCHPKDDLVDRLQRFSFLPPCYPSYEASDFCPGGTHLPLNTPAFAGHTTGRADFRHPAFRLASPQTHERGFTWRRRSCSTPNSPNTAGMLKRLVPRVCTW